MDDMYSNANSLVNILNDSTCSTLSGPQLGQEILTCNPNHHNPSKGEIEPGALCMLDHRKLFDDDLILLSSSL
ncbi:hypothetical protein H8356DRAFT_1346796 [Neocallimastix lanati (nom. inval.)]|nr:hypothetical protein H8356DRAFT_1346796 [Neocallimastix sp. JGI-2020a]